MNPQIIITHYQLQESFRASWAKCFGFTAMCWHYWLGSALICLISSRSSRQLFPVGKKPNSLLLAQHQNNRQTKLADIAGVHCGAFSSQIFPSGVGRVQTRVKCRPIFVKLPNTWLQINVVLDLLDVINCLLASSPCQQDSEYRATVCDMIMVQLD